MLNSTALLNTIRDLMNRIESREVRAAETNMPADNLLDDLLYHLAALDEQLSRGGPLPREWNVRPNHKADVEGWEMKRSEFVQAGTRFTRLIPPYDRSKARRAAARYLRAKAKRR